MRAGDVVQRLFSKRDPEKDTYVKMANRLGYKSTGSITDLLAKDDMYVSTLYKICKYFGYVIVIMNPKDNSGKSDMVISMKRQPMPLCDSEGKKMKGRPRKKVYRPTKSDKYRNRSGKAPKPVVLKGSLVEKKEV